MYVNQYLICINQYLITNEPTHDMHIVATCRDEDIFWKKYTLIHMHFIS